MLGACDSRNTTQQGNTVEKAVDEKTETLRREIRDAYVEVHDDVDELREDIKDDLALTPEQRDKLRAKYEVLRKTYDDAKRRAAGLDSKAREELEHLASEIESKMKDIDRKLKA